MIKYIPILMLLFVSGLSMAKETLYNGVLQAYWMPVWNGTVNTPQLKYRYMSLNKNRELIGVYNLDIDSENLLRRYFKNIPDHFYTFREGHIEQGGSITLEQTERIPECGHVSANARMLSFTPENVPAFNLDKLEKSAGCESYPYAVTFIVKPESAPVYFKKQPNNHAENGQIIPRNTPLIRVKTIDSHWVQVAIYSERAPGLAGNPVGFVEIDKLAPVN